MVSLILLLWEFIMSEPKYKIELKADESLATLKAEGHFSEMILKDFERNLNEALSKDKVIVDLENLEYICSWGFGIMVEKSQTAQEHGRNIVFVKPKNRLWRLFELLQLNLILKFADSNEEAFLMLENNFDEK